MLSIVNYGGYVAAAAALCLTPGIDTVYILMRTISGGRREGLASALGINTGLVVHTLLVAAGLSLVLAASPVAFNVIKIAGALYLAVMGVRSIAAKGGSFAQLKSAAGEKGRGPADAGENAASVCAGKKDGPAANAAGECADEAEASEKRKIAASVGSGGNPWRTYAQGVLTNVLNPKIILFFLALLPQFIAVPNQHGPLPFLVLGLTYVVLSTAWTVVIVLIATPFAKLLSRSARAGRVAGIVSGVVYVILGAMILLTE